MMIDDNNHVLQKSFKKQSLWRHWNRLSSLQRSLIFLILLVCFVTFLSFYKFQSTLEEINFNLNQKRSFKEELIDPRVVLPSLINIKRDSISDIFAKNAVEDIKRKAKFYKKFKNRTFHERPIIIPSRIGPYPIKGPTNDRMQKVVDAFKHSWQGYKKFAWGKDELKPMTGSYSEWFGVGLTLIDSLDTMYIMGLNDEFKDATNWVKYNLTFDVNKDVNLFECTIRILGGLLSAYHLSQESIFLERAIDLGNRLMSAFNSGSPIPYSDVNLKEHTAHAPRWGPDSSTSEVTTIQLEFTDLSRSSGNHKYENAVLAVMKHVHSLPKKEGLVPIFINAVTGQFRHSSTITLGARGDSYYEYLLKMWLQTGLQIAKDDYIEAIAGMEKFLMRESQPNNLLYIGELLGGTSFSPKMDHLVCFIGGNLALAYKNGLSSRYLELAKKLTDTCIQMYNKMPTGLSPEIAYFNTIKNAASNDIIVKTADSHNLQRPETIESLFYLYRITGNKTYQDQGWKIFQAFEKYTKVKNGYTSIGNVLNVANTQPKNKMESFWLSETLKYFYLLFSNDFDLISIDEFIFTTEAHLSSIYSNT